VHLRFAAGTEDLPLHVHEFSDRLLVVTSGLGLFHYLPDAAKSRELRSVVVETGDVVLFTRGVVHTFTAPVGDLTLLSYHAPFFAFDDVRQFTIPANRFRVLASSLPNLRRAIATMRDAAVSETR
jgi:mannose-6-phosphate isomerase-like protein (cupin superfamily)